LVPGRSQALASRLTVHCCSLQTAIDVVHNVIQPKSYGISSLADGSMVNYSTKYVELRWLLKCETEQKGPV
jgi:hypothetical protein